MKEKPSFAPEEARRVVDTRRQRVERLRQRVEGLFSGEEHRELRADIERSFLVPQTSNYHNEGPFMDSHLDLIWQQIEAVADGHFPAEVPQHARRAMARALERDRRAVEKYVFLHDIAKADCLTITLPEGKREMSWSTWTSWLSADREGTLALAGDGEALQRILARHGVSGISYWQATSERQHGDVGADKLRHAGIADATMLAAIEAHEVAYQFSDVNVKTYEKYFSDMLPEARDFALLASYTDTMSALRPDGKPDLAAWLALAASKEKSEQLHVLLLEMADGRVALETIEQALANLRRPSAEQKGARLSELIKTICAGHFEPQKLERAFINLRNSDEALPAETRAAVADKLRRETKIPSFDVAAAEPELRTFLEGTLTSARMDELLATLANAPRELGRRFGKELGAKMRGLNDLLRRHEK